MSSTNTYHTLQRTWASQANPSGQAQHKKFNPVGANAKYSLERWVGESMKDQPWNRTGQFADRRVADRHHEGREESTGGEMGSTAKSGK